MMGKKTFLAFLVTLIFSFISCNEINANKQVKLRSDSARSELNQSDSVGLDHSQTRNFIHEDTTKRDLTQDSILGLFFDSRMVLYLSLGISLLSLIVVICFFVILFILKPQWFANYVIDEIIVDSYNHKGRIFKLINDHTKKSENQTMLSERNIESIVNKRVESHIDIIVDKVLESIRQDKEGKSASENQQDDVLNSSISENLYLYASSADINSNSFYKVTSHPDDDSIYKLLVNGDKSQFSVYDRAFGKVIVVPDFLECACEVVKTGSQSVTTIRHGIAERGVDGKWMIKSKAKVIIN